jgi:glycosyltransferase involved in cell wall biosynthesis
MTNRLPISLVIPAYRAERYITRALESVRNAAFVPSEIIVIDDASDDRTGALAAAAGARVIRFPRNAGPSAARNAGVIAAREPWVAFLDADDVWLDGKLLAQWEALQRWPDAGFCFTDYDVVDVNRQLARNEMARDAGYALVRPAERRGDAVRFDESGFVPGLVRSMFIRQSSAIVKRELFMRAGGYDESLRLAEDYDLFLRLARMAPAVAVERALVTYLRQPRSLSADPLAEVSAIDHLWTSILERPERYPRRAVELIRRRRHSTLDAGCTIALRLGRFHEAAAFARLALTFERSPLSLSLLALAIAFDNRAGIATYAAGRRVWRRFRPDSAAVEAQAPLP